MNKPGFAIVGCGRLGTALALHLTRAGYPLTGLLSKSPVSAEQTAAIVGTDKFGVGAWDLTRIADVIFITTPDGAISETCTTLAENKAIQRGAVVLHCSGAHPSTILSDAQKAGALIGSMHPLQSFASKTVAGNPFENIIISIEGNEKAVTIAKVMAESLGAICMTIPTEAKTLYHASAVVASNYLVTLMDLAFSLMGTAGICSTDAYRMLKPLIWGTLSNIEKVGIPEALTGPIARGDVETVERHLKAMSEKTPEYMALYKILGLYTVNIAKAKGTLPDAAAEAILKRLKCKE
jgi:predicted short-subunit dehydrogenase-like oxidoreductase (DUF2520 family)